MTSSGQSVTPPPVRDMEAFVRGWVSGWLEGGGEMHPDIARQAVDAYARHRAHSSTELPEPWRARLSKALEEVQAQ
jgi:hypothetical protein